MGLSHIYYDMTVREREMMILYEALEKQFCCFLPYAYSHLAAPFAYFIVACLHVCDCTYKRVGEGAGAFLEASNSSSSASRLPENTTVGLSDKSGFADNVKSLYIEESIALGT